MILTFSLDTHLGIIEALDHGDRKIEHDVGEEHGCEQESEPEEQLVAIMEPCRVRLANRDVEDEEDLISVSHISTSESVERTSKGEDEAEEDDKEEAHQVHDFEYHPDQMANLTEVPQEVEQLEE